MKHFCPAILVRFQFCKILVSNSALKIYNIAVLSIIINLILQILYSFLYRYIAHALRIIHTYLVVPAQLTSSEVFVKAKKAVCGDSDIHTRVACGSRNSEHRTFSEDRAKK